MTSATSSVPKTADPSPGEPPAGSFRELLVVAVPLMISAGSLSLMQVVDRIFLTWLSKEALAAALPAAMLHWTLLSFPIGIAAYTNTFVSQYHGANRKDRVAASVWQGAYLALVGGLMFLMVLPLADDLIRWMGHKPTVQQLEQDYFSVFCLGATPILVVVVLSAFFSGRGKTAVVMWVNLFVVMLNIVLDYLMIFGWGPIPEMGVKGAAWATVLSKCVAGGLYVALLFRARKREQYPILKEWRFDPELCWRFLKFGLPNGLQFMVDVSGFTLFVVLVGKLGDDQLAASNLVFSLNTMAFVPMIGLGTGVLTLVGRRVGEERPELAVRTTWLAAAVASGWMAIFVVFCLFAPNLLMMPYLANVDEAAEFAAIRPTVVVLLRFIAAFSFFDAMAVVFGAAVRGAGDTRFSMLLTFGSGWLLMVLPVYVLTRMDANTLMRSWWAITAYITAIGIGFVLRFQQGKWKTMRVIESDISQAEEDAEVIAEAAAL